MSGALMVCGTTSDSGKSTVVAGLCRALSRVGVNVAPFKGQNMALNSAVTAGGHEIGRATAAQASAAGVEPDVLMNPVLLKPTSDRSSQVIVMGKPWKTLDAVAYHDAKKDLAVVVDDALAELKQLYDVVLCEGAGSPAEINLLDRDIVNLRVAQRAGVPALLVGDIDRGGVFASLYGTVAILPPELRDLIKGFVINKLRGDPALLAGAGEQLRSMCGVPTLGVLPWTDHIGLEAEDSLALGAPLSPAGGMRQGSGDALDVAVIRFPRISNFTDLDPLLLEPTVGVRWVSSASNLGSPDLIILPGTKATVEDLGWLRSVGLDEAVLAACERGSMILGICGGYQMLGTVIVDGVECSDPDPIKALGLLGSSTVFAQDKVTRQRQGVAMGAPVRGYEIHHGITEHEDPWIELEEEGQRFFEGSRDEEGKVLGTSLHGLFDSDPLRAEILHQVARSAGKRWVSSGLSFQAERDARYERLADLMEEHLDMGAIAQIIMEGKAR